MNDHANPAATLSLRDPGLLRQQCLIDGQWADADSGATCAVHNPATGNRLGSVPDMAASETGRAIAAARKAQPAWAAKTAKQRADVLEAMHDEMMVHQEDLARLMTAEQGKPLAEARGEIAYSAAFLKWFAEEGRRLYGDLIPAHGSDKRVLVMRQPIGVVAAITPWNFPSAMLGRKLGPALAAGCTMVCKPALETPYSALAIAEIAQRAGLPAGALNIVTGADAAAIGETLTAHPDVRKLSFTGSTAVGRKLLAQCAPGIKRTSLELGGNAPFIVFADADLDAAVAGAIACKYRNSGQTCVCANRLFIHDSLYDEFARRLVAEVERLRVGDGLAGETDQGPLINDKALDKVEQHVADAEKHGARVAIGGARHELGGTFYQPTVLLDVSADMRVAREETFGPVAPLIRFHGDDEVIAMANDSDAGLAAYFYTRDLARTWRISEALEYGIIGINTGVISTEVAPFGGIKQSGFGREGSKYGLDEYTEIKYACIGGI